MVQHVPRIWESGSTFTGQLNHTLAKIDSAADYAFICEKNNEGHDQMEPLNVDQFLL